MTNGASNDASIDVALDAASCPDEPVSAAQIASTPRADADLEMLALMMKPGYVADGSVYDRVVRDVGAIRAENAAVADLHVREPYPQKLRIFADRATALSMQAGAYHAWDCHDAFWRATDQHDYSFATDGSAGSTTLAFVGFYAIDRVARLYKNLPGVFQVQVSSMVGDGPTLFGWIDGDTFHYAFDQAGGDCPAGCTTHHVWHYTSTPDGSNALVEVIDVGAYGLPTPPPWFSHRSISYGPCVVR